jgi:ABC-type glycerol-3-phosphate transport system substrate-binding protein
VTRSLKARLGLVITSAALLVGACGGTAGSAEPEQSGPIASDAATGSAPPAGGGELNVLVEGGGLQLQEAIGKKFEEATGTKVNFVEAPYAGVYEKLVAEMASGGSAYDVATLDVIWLPTFAPFATPLDDLFTDEVKADLFPSLVADAQIDGSFVGMPQWANSEILFYRTDLFEDPAQQTAFKAAYGYDLKPPTTWQEFEDAAKFFTQDTDGDGQIDLYGTDVKGAVETEWLAHVLQAGSPGTVLDADGNVIIDNAQHLAALEYYARLNCTDKVSPSGVAQIGWAEAQNLFYQGQTAMLRFWAHAYRLTPEDSKVEGKVGVAPMIAGEAGVAGIPGPWYNIVPKGSKNIDLAKQFVKFAYDNNVLGIEAPLGLAARISAYEQYQDQAGFEHFAPLLATLNATATTGRPLVEDWQQITDEVLVPLVQSAASCDGDPAQLLAEAKAQIEALQ